MTFSMSHAQKTDREVIIKTIQAFANAGDDNDYIQLDKLLDNNYRVVMNRLFGSTDVSIVPKAVYLEKIRSKEWGGDTRILTIEEVLLNNTTASAKVVFEGTKMTFVSILMLVKNADNEWVLISDTPVVM